MLVVSLELVPKTVAVSPGVLLVESSVLVMVAMTMELSENLRKVLDLNLELLADQQSNPALEL